MAIGTVVSARDALENNGHLHEDVDVTVTTTRDSFVIVAPTLEMVNKVTWLVETYAQPF